MTPFVRIELEGEPVPWQRPRWDSRNRRTFSDPKTEKYEQALAWAGRRAMAGRDPLGGPLAITMLAVLPVPASWSKKKRTAALAGAVRPTSKPDLDNLAKNKDALNKIVWLDDSQIVREVLDKIYGERPRLVVDVYLPGGGAP